MLKYHEKPKEDLGWKLLLSQDDCAVCYNRAIPILNPEQQLKRFAKGLKWSDVFKWVETV